MSGLPTPPTEDQKSHPIRKSSKQTKLVHRASKRSNPTHEHPSVVIDGRHKRVWKACERCRMKKTKCDGESPCKRCKDDGLVCTAGSRKKTEFKQLPRGYAEVLENTQYALIATVQKLYTMIRNNESWDLGEPELNDRGQPVIHDIASKLGCIRPSPDLPYSFPEGADDFAELQAQLAANQMDVGSEERKHSEDSTYSSPPLERTERASSSDSDSDHSADYNKKLWEQHQQQLPQNRQQGNKTHPPTINTSIRPQASTFVQRSDILDDESSYSARTSFDASIPSPIYTMSSTESPMFRPSTPPFVPWGETNQFLAESHALDITSEYIRQPQFKMSRPSPLSAHPMMNMEMTKMPMQMNDGLPGMIFGDGTIRPGMLTCNTGYDMTDSMENMMFSPDYEVAMKMA